METSMCHRAGEVRRMSLENFCHWDGRRSQATLLITSSSMEGTDRLWVGMYEKENN